MQNDEQTRMDTPGEAPRIDAGRKPDAAEEMAHPESESEKIHGDKLEDAVPPGKKNR